MIVIFDISRFMGAYPRDPTPPIYLKRGQVESNFFGLLVRVLANHFLASHIFTFDTL